MTKVLLQVLPTPLCGPRGDSGGRGDPSTRAPSVLDWGCGSGVIAGYLRLAEPFLDLHLLDADALALRAASRNVPGAQCYWSDCWRGVDDLVDDRRFAAENVGGAVEKASPPACAAEGPAAERGKLQRMPLLDAIVSNPPVHAGLLDSLSVLEALVEGAARRLRPSTGVLWVVAQEHVPVGCVLELHGGYRDVRMQSQGRFTVWSASLLLR